MFFFSETAAGSNTYNINYQRFTYATAAIPASGPAVTLTGSQSTLASNISNVTSYDWDFTNSSFILGYETTAPGATTKTIVMQGFAPNGAALGPAVNVATLPVGTSWAVRANSSTASTLLVEDNSATLASVVFKNFDMASGTLSTIGTIHTNLHDITALPYSLNLANKVFAFGGTDVNGNAKIEFDTIDSSYNVIATSSVTLAGATPTTRIMETTLPNNSGGIFSYVDPNDSSLHLVQVDGNSAVLQNLTVGQASSVDRVRSFGDGRVEVEWRTTVSGAQNEVHVAIFDTRTSGISTTGGSGSDDIAGTPFDDSISGGAGDDRIAASTGSDSLDGGAGSDTVILPFALSAARFSYDLSGHVIVDGPGTHAVLSNFETFQFQDGLAHPWLMSPVSLQDFGLSEGWGSANNPRRLADVDLTGSADYLGFGAEYTFVSNGITGADGSGNTGPGFTAPAAVIHDFGTNEGYTAQAQRGAANTGYGVAATIYGQGFAGIYWYGATARSAHTDAAGKTYYTLTYDSTPHFYANFGTQQGWTPHNGFQVLKTSRADTYASILGFGNDGIVVGGQAFAPGADASQVTVLPASIGNNAGWDQLTDVRTFLDSDGGIVDLNHDGVADFIGMGPQGTVFAYGQEDPSSHQYTLGPVQTATFGGGSTDLGRAQGWTDQNTQRLIVHDAVTGYDDILAFGAAGVFVAEGQDPASHGGQPFGALHLAIADFGSNQGWSNAQTPRLVGDVNGDGTPDIVGFGASSTFVALGSRDASGHLSFTMDPTKQINDFGYQEGWDSATTVRALADVDGSGHQSLVLSGYAGTQAWHLA
ncbi:hypothetical protein [Methylobacterium sp. JK268]